MNERGTRLCSTGHNGPEPCIRDDVAYALRSEEPSERCQGVLGHKENGLPQVPHILTLDESLVAVHLPVVMQGVPEDEPADPSAL